TPDGELVSAPPPEHLGPQLVRGELLSFQLHNRFNLTRGGLGGLRGGGFGARRCRSRARSGCRPSRPAGPGRPPSPRSGAAAARGPTISTPPAAADARGLPPRGGGR